MYPYCKVLLELLSIISISKGMFSTEADQNNPSGANWIDPQPIRTAQRDTSAAIITFVYKNQLNGAPIGHSSVQSCIKPAPY